MVNTMKYRWTIAAVTILTLLTAGVPAQKPTDPTLLPKYEEAQKLRREALRLILIEGTPGSKRAAILKYIAARSLLSSIGSKEDEATTCNNIGMVYSDLGDKQKALESYNQSLALARQAGSKSVEAIALSNLGSVYSDLGEKQKALEFFELSVPLRRQTGDKTGEAITLNKIGGLYSDLGEQQKALDFYNLSLPLRRQAGDKRGEAETLGNIGTVYTDLGEPQKALEFHDRSLALVRETGYKIDEAFTLNNIGSVHSDLGDKQRALEFYKQSLALARQVGNERVEAVTLNNIATVYSDLGEKRKALEFFDRSLPLRRQIGDKSGEAVTLNNIGSVYYDLGDKQKALEIYIQSLTLRKQVGDKRGEAITLGNIGSVYSDLGERQKALELHSQSLPLMRQAGNKRGEAVTLNNMMHLWGAQKVLNLAVLYGKQSVNVYQELRKNIQGLDKKTQKTYLGSIEITYRSLADLLIKQGRIAEAEQVLGMLKEEEYFSYLRRDDKVAADLKSRISLSPLEKIAFEEYERHADGITAAAQEFGVLEKKKNDLLPGESLTAADQKRYDALKAKYDAAVTVFNKFLDDLKVKFGKNDQRVAGIESDTQGILKRLNEPRTVIISTIVGEDRLNLIVTTPDLQKAHTVDIKAADVNKLVAEFRDAVQNTRSDPRAAGKRLYDTLFPAALQKDLANIKADTIVWSLDGTLRYVPMAALWDGEKYLAERYRQAVLTLASRDKLTPQTKNVGSFVFGVGVSKPFENFSALPAVPRELCSVIDDPGKAEFCKPHGGGNGVMKGFMLTDDEFTLAAFKNNVSKTQVSVVHVASHFSMNAGDVTNSYLLLGGGGERRFSMDDLRKTASLGNIDILTLSACNTAMGSGVDSAGVEVESFGKIAQDKGVRTVLATLWAVADESTSLLMSEFYRLRKEDPSMSKAAAMQAAQKAMIAGKIKSSGTGGTCRADEFVTGTKQNDFKCDPNAPFSHPYFWSPFVLMGNWK